jgi:hypothetical protein
MIILSVIYMHNGQMDQRTLFHFLSHAGISLEYGAAVFPACYYKPAALALTVCCRNWFDNLGSMETYLDKVLVSDKYLQKIKRIETDGSSYEYRWGSHARALVSERDIISFIAQVLRMRRLCG